MTNRQTFSEIPERNCLIKLFKFFSTVAVASLAFWGIGFAFAVGDGGTSANFFISYKRFFLIEATPLDYQSFGHEVIVCGLVIVLVNSGFIARLRHWVYPIVTFFIAGMFGLFIST